MIDLKKYKQMNFNEEQLYQIEEGLEEGLDVSIFTKPEYEWDQMEQILEGLIEGTDISIDERN